MQIISRDKAMKLGLTRYFTGKPCKHGHLEERFTGSASCLKCNQAAALKYYNKEGVKEHVRIKKAEQRAKYTDARRKYIKEENKLYYHLGPINPKGDSQCLSKSKAMLRLTRRLLRNPEFLT